MKNWGPIKKQRRKMWRIKTMIWHLHLTIIILCVFIIDNLFTIHFSRSKFILDIFNTIFHLNRINSYVYIFVYCILLMVEALILLLLFKYLYHFQVTRVRKRIREHKHICINLVACNSFHVYERVFVCLYGATVIHCSVLLKSKSVYKVFFSILTVHIYLAYTAQHQHPK